MNATQTPQNITSAVAREASRRMVERTFKTWDGTELFYRAWLPAKTTNKALVLFHRGHEHSGRWQETVTGLG